ncbi:hypothetical protein ABEG75_22600 [Pantoea agglomerans]|uniref:hypothetical protein n=1 Tax=Enterobacter agglomerans TaxID=549 RepID=UPI0016545F65|nr:hypothetical protein [Pantoea agglomerans]
MNIAQLHGLLDKVMKSGVLPETKVTVLTDDLALINDSQVWNGGVCELQYAQLVTTHYTVDNSPKMNISFDKDSVLVLMGVGSNLSDAGEVHKEFFHDD